MNILQSLAVMVSWKKGLPVPGETGTKFRDDVLEILIASHGDYAYVTHVLKELRRRGWKNLYNNEVLELYLKNQGFRFEYDPRGTRVTV